VGVNVRRESAIALNLQRPNAAQSLFGRYLETGKLRELPELICKWRRRKRRRTTINRKMRSCVSKRLEKKLEFIG